MISQVSLQNFLVSKLGEAQKKNPSYSLRSFAETLGIDATRLSQILKGKTKVSEKLASKMLDRLEIDLDSRSRILIKNQILQTPVTEVDEASLKEDQKRLVADWYHYAILSLTQVKDVKSHSTWIADRLGLTEKQVHGAIARMKRDLKVAQRSLIKRSIDEQGTAHLTLPTNPDRIRRAKLYLKKAQAELLEILIDTTDRAQEYRLSFALKPILKK